MVYLLLSLGYNHDHSVTLIISKTENRNKNISEYEFVNIGRSVINIH